jgi:hypothetical protein
MHSSIVTLSPESRSCSAMQPRHLFFVRRCYMQAPHQAGTRTRGRSPSSRTGRSPPPTNTRQAQDRTGPDRKGRHAQATKEETGQSKASQPAIRQANQTGSLQDSAPLQRQLQPWLWCTYHHAAVSQSPEHVLVSRFLFNCRLVNWFSLQDPGTCSLHLKQYVHAWPEFANGCMLSSMAACWPHSPHDICVPQARLHMHGTHGPLEISLGTPIMPRALKRFLPFTLLSYGTLATWLM